MSLEHDSLNTIWIGANGVAFTVHHFFSELQKISKNNRSEPPIFRLVPTLINQSTRLLLKTAQSRHNHDIEEKTEKFPVPHESVNETMCDIKILDGGFSTQLALHVGNKIDGDPLWTARFLSSNPDAVFATHLDFLRAGSDIIETNSYQASIEGFMKYLNVSKDESIELIRKAVECAKKAVDTYLQEVKDNTNITNPKPLIAGSCGPYGAALHDGSEYTGLYGKQISSQILKNWHRPRISILLEAGVDFLAFETVPCKEEAEVIVELLKEFPNAKAWLCFSCHDDGKTIADGTDFQEVAVECYKKAQPGQIIGVGVNCIAPQYITSLLKGINKEDSSDFIPLVIYPNSGEKYTVAEGWKKDGKCYPSQQFVHEWLDLGVRYIGGCCRTQATDVKKIRASVNDWIKMKHSLA